MILTELADVTTFFSAFSWRVSVVIAKLCASAKRLCYFGTKLALKIGVTCTKVFTIFRLSYDERVLYITKVNIFAYH